MTRWWWVRHGPTHEKSFVGWRDVPADLSDTAQIKRLNGLLPETATLVASDLIRASATADAVQTPQRKRLPDTPQIREFNFGDWDGLGFQAVSDSDPELARRYWEEPGDVRPPNGESWNDAAARLAQVVDQMNRDIPNGDIIAVAHFGVIMTQIQRAMGCTPYQALGHKIDNLSITTLTHEAGDWTVKQINRVP
ncbi:histidine phosphatase family protein [Algirhabdus cladophorae]|uniref:histidine phosphatase family protein n=1 Tax=Algirhabdus cladophorae TaxID=3377108 RepID=UPI003B84A220